MILLYVFLFRILDDMEMYEQQDPFKLSDFVTISYFLNQFLYKAVLNNLFGACYNLCIIFFYNIVAIILFFDI